jgi:hypothetical protein
MAVYSAITSRFALISAGQRDRKDTIIGVISAVVISRWWRRCRLGELNVRVLELCVRAMRRAPLWLLRLRW